MRFPRDGTKTASDKPGVAGHVSPEHSPETDRPEPTTDGYQAPIFLIEVASKDRSCFHRASTARRPWKQLPVGLDKTVVPTMS
jgi:hypothetical protein